LELRLAIELKIFVALKPLIKSQLFVYYLSEFPFFLLISWINLLWRKVCFPRRGGRLIYRELFTFQQMLSFLRQAVDKIYQVVDTIYLPSG